MFILPRFSVIIVSCSENDPFLLTHEFNLIIYLNLFISISFPFFLSCVFLFSIIKLNFIVLYIIFIKKELNKMNWYKRTLCVNIYFLFIFFNNLFAMNFMNFTMASCDKKKT